MISFILLILLMGLFIETSLGSWADEYLEEEKRKIEDDFSLTEIL